MNEGLSRDVQRVETGPDNAVRQQYYAESWALVIGTDYRGTQHPLLPNAGNDARAVARMLSDSYRFEHVVTLYDKQATLKAIMTWLRDELRDQVGPDDRLVFFFAGHGTTDARSERRQGYLVPYDARPDKYADCVDMEELVRACGLIKAKHIFFILDCCFSGVAAVAGRAEPPVPPDVINDVYLERITERTAWQILTAGASDERVADSGLRPGHSAFTAALIAGLGDLEADQNRDNLITASELAAYMRPRVTRETAIGRARGQTPFFNYLAGSGEGDFVFVVPGRKPVVQPAGVLAKRVEPILERYALWVMASLVLLTLLVLAGYLTHLEYLKFLARGPAVDFPAGTALLGDDRHEVRMDAFSLERYEVTNRQYRLCMRAGSCSVPHEPADFNGIDDTDRDHFPVVWVDAYQAATYCNWIGRRLPTQAEWERAVRGAGGRTWPWGEDDPTPSHVNLMIPSISGFPEDSVPVDDPRFAEGATPDGNIAHLLGNASEWTSTPSSCSDPYECSPVWDGKERVQSLNVVGLSWSDDLDPTDKHRVTEALAALPTHFSMAIGFRCAR